MQRTKVIRYTQITNHIDSVPDTNLNNNMKKHYRSTNRSNNTNPLCKFKWDSKQVNQSNSSNRTSHIHIMAIMETKVKTANPLALRRQTYS